MSWFVWLWWLLCNVLCGNAVRVAVVDSLVYTTEEVDLQRIEKHVGLWRFDLERHHGSGAMLESLMATRLMRECTLLMRALLQYGENESVRGDLFEPVRRGQLSFGGGQTVENPGVSERGSKVPSGGKGETKERGSWAGEGVVVEENVVKRAKRNVFGEILHQLTGVATDAELQQQLRIDEELRDKMTAAMTRQVAYEQEITGVIGNLTQEEEKVMAMLKDIAEKHEFDMERNYRMAAHRFTMMEDVDQLEDIVEAVLSGKVNSRHAVYLSAKAGLSHVASYQFMNITKSRKGVIVTYLSRLYSWMDGVETVITPVYHLLATPVTSYYLHSTRELSLGISEEEVRGTQKECEKCAIIVHLSGGMYLVVRSGVLTCSERGVSGRVRVYQEGATFSVLHGESCSNEAVVVSSGGMHMSLYAVSTGGDDPLDALVLKRKSAAANVTKVLHQSAAAHAAMNIRLRQNVGAAQADIKNMIAETQQSFDIYSVSTYSTFGWLGVISVIVCSMLCLVLLQCYRVRRERRRNAELSDV